MPNDVSTRFATASDYAELGVVFDEAERFHRLGLPDVFREPRDRFPSQALFSEWIEADSSAVFVAVSDGQPVGFVVVEQRDSPESDSFVPRKLAHVGLLAVRTNARRLGAGRALTEDAASWASERGLDAVSLNVWEFNTSAIEFYEAIGFETKSRVMERRL